MKIIELNKLNKLNELKNELKEKENPTSVWAVDVEFPHIITKHTKAHNSTSKVFFESPEEAFVARREMSPYYMKAYKDHTQFDRYITEQATITAQ